MIPCPQAYNLQHIDDMARLKEILNEAKFRRDRVNQYITAVRMRMAVVYAAQKDIEE